MHARANCVLPDRPYRLVHLGIGHGFGYSNAPAVNEDGILLEEDKQLALWLDNWSEADSMALILVRGLACIYMVHF